MGSLRDARALERRVAVARRRLASLPDEPRVARHELIGALRHAVPCEFGLEYRTVYSGGEWRLGGDFVIAEDAWSRVFSLWVGERIDARSHSYDPELPPPDEVNRFTGVKPAHRRARAYDGLYVRYGLTQLRTLVYDGTAFLGWMGLLRSEIAGFTTAERHALDSLSPSLASSLRAVRRLEATEIDDIAPAHLVFGPTGRLLHVTAEATPWLTRERRDFLSSFVRRADAMREPLTALDGAAVSVRRLIGEGTVYLVNLVRAELPRRSALASLTGRRREVAEYAAVGATAKEIAETLGISSHTVRQHLKVAYRDLGVGSRVELARLLEESEPRGRRATD